jgi:hypothetical protein
MVTCLTADPTSGLRDDYCVVELPDNQGVATVEQAVNSAGLASVRTLVLLTPAEIDAATRVTVNDAPPRG